MRRRAHGFAYFSVTVLRVVRICCVLLLISPSVRAQVCNWHIDDFKDTIAIGEDGNTLVSERITLVFVNQCHGIHRKIPVEYPGPDGTNYTLFLNVVGVTDENGHKLKYESSKSGDFRDLKIYIPGANDATRVVNIDYKIRNAIRFFDDHDEFYWNVTGSDWPVPIAHAAAFVTLPPKAAGGLRAQAFTGVYGSTDHAATVEVKGSDVTSETTDPLPMRGGLTIDIFIPKGVIDAPGGLTKALWFLGSNPIVFLPLLMFAVMFGVWRMVGKDPEAGVSVAPMYEPPKGFTPAEVGTLIDDSTDPRDITSTIVDLAVRGYVKIEEKVESFLVFKKKDYVFHLLKPREQWGNDLCAHERVMLENIFAGGSDTPLSSLKNRFYTAIPVIRQDIMASLKAKGMYLLDPGSAGGYSIAALVGIGLVIGALYYLGWTALFNSIPLLIGSGLISALIWWLFARQMTAKTMLGVRTVISILGFQEFMNRVDADRIKRLPPDTFEKYLGFAMALGVEQHWAQAFAGMVKDPPSWYVGATPYSGFNPIFFASSMHSMSSDMHQVFVSAPRSNSSGSGYGGGGGGGGGFSGGGFGGGGGSAF